MSYARFGEDSGVYVIFNTAGKYECCMCSMGGGCRVMADLPAEMIWHLKKHVARGDRVPPYTFDELRGEDEPVVSE